MYLSDLAPKELVQEIFDAMKQQTLKMLPSTVNFSLRFTNEDRLRIYATEVAADAGHWRYEIRITERLLHLVTNYFFALARCVPSANGIELPDAQASGIPLPFVPQVETVEQKLNQIDPDAEIDNDRISLFLDYAREAWSILLFHETAHITEGHLRFIQENEALFRSQAAYSRACEYEADRVAARWVTERILLNGSPWKRGALIGDNLAKIDPHFLAEVASLLFLLSNVDAGLQTENYLHSDVRHFMMITNLMKQLSWDSDEASHEALLKHMTAATDKYVLMLGQPSLRKPTLIMSISLEDQGTAFAQVYDEWVTHSPEWERYRFRR